MLIFKSDLTVLICRLYCIGFYLQRVCEYNLLLHRQLYIDLLYGIGVIRDISGLTSANQTTVGHLNVDYHQASMFRYFFVLPDLNDLRL